MSGSPGSSSAGTQGGRTPRNDNADIVERHGRPGGRNTGGTDAESSARPPLSGERDSRAADPDRPDATRGDESRDDEDR